MATEHAFLLLHPKSVLGSPFPYSLNLQGLQFSIWRLSLIFCLGAQIVSINLTWFLLQLKPPVDFIIVPIFNLLLVPFNIHRSHMHFIIFSFHLLPNIWLLMTIQPMFLIVVLWVMTSPFNQSSIQVSRNTLHTCLHFVDLWCYFQLIVAPNYWKISNFASMLFSILTN